MVLEKRYCTIVLYFLAQNFLIFCAVSLRWFKMSQRKLTSAWKHVAILEVGWSEKNFVVAATHTDGGCCLISKRTEVLVF